MLLGQRVTVIGGGIAGLAAALAAALRGAEVTLLEQAPGITEVGAGIQVSPNGWAVLKALGLAEDIAAKAPRSRAVRLRDFRRGAEVFSFPLTREDRPWHFVHRADLVDTLADAARAAGVRLRLGTRVETVAIDGDETSLTLADGTVETHGLTLAADGLSSPARTALNARSRPYFTGQVAWRATLPDDGSLPAEAHVFMGPGRHLVRYPLRQGRLVNIVAVEERDDWAAEGWHHTDDPANLARAFADFCPEVRDLLARVGTAHLWGLFRHPVAPVWTGGRLALLGDAAHPTLPFLAQGANMALEDAWVLVRCLAEDTDTAAALAAYAALRRPRCARIVQAAEDNATAYHLRPGPLRFAAHSALRLAARTAPHLVTARFEWVHGHDVTKS
ncbi:FAD-dependent monooxygenase [Roseibacterium sp. SDUM158016]|uniref:FAD-dependent oxidoreductase n=1 Tax=Roseicyclus sediminis TaxID=2980997 RepID=UPI0021D3A6B2|nr:FAD-dependent oxidoreductase [Roseibacterium sp. SDUM158016]MCU4653811.1 FAD-dependent monooxygenase [Roseibacterium sp. SDUM158016]